MENQLVRNADQGFEAWYRVQAGPLHGVNVLKKALSVGRLGIGTLQSFFLLLRKRPKVVFSTGGWVGLPITLAAWLLRIPVIIFVPDIEPGRTLKVLGRFSKVITATVEDTAGYYPPNKRVVETGYPLRPSLLSVKREDGIQHFGLDNTKQTLLIFGGSHGSRAINRATYQNIEALLEVPDLQILHISGKLDAVEVETVHNQLTPEIKARYHIRDYVYDMGLAFAAADVVLSRAGASTLGEFPLFGLPSILVPLAYEWRYQEINADWLADRGAAIRLDEPKLKDEMVSTVHRLLKDRHLMETMREAALSLKRTNGAANIANTILNLANQ